MSDRLVSSARELGRGFADCPLEVLARIDQLLAGFTAVLPQGQEAWSPAKRPRRQPLKRLPGIDQSLRRIVDRPFIHGSDASAPGTAGRAAYSSRGGPDLYPFERFSGSAKGVLTLAQEEAERRRHSYIGTEHLLLGLIRQEDAVGAAALKNLGIHRTAIRAAVDSTMLANPRELIEEAMPTARVKRVIELAFDEARSDNRNVVGTGHLLVGLMLENDGIAAQVLRELTLAIDSVRAELARLEEAGVTEAVDGVGRPPFLHRHLDLADRQGKTITIDIVFPPDYSQQQCTEVASRIQSAVQGSQS